MGCGRGIGECLPLTDSAGSAQPRTIRCSLFGCWLSLKGAILKDHRWGRNTKQADGTYERKPGFHAQKAAAAAPRHGHIKTSDRRNMSNDTLRHLAMMYRNKDEELDNEDSE